MPIVELENDEVFSLMTILRETLHEEINHKRNAEHNGDTDRVLFKMEEIRTIDTILGKVNKSLD